MPTISSARPPRDSRRWRQAAQRNRPADGAENRRFVWLLAATITLVLGLVGGLLLQSSSNDALADRPASFRPL